MAALAPELRRDLENVVVAARGLAEAGARAAIVRLGVDAADAPSGLSSELRALRTALRERAKALGAGVRTLGIPLLVEEIAYEQWHRMLFARFLAENDLLLHPEGAPVSIAEVRELAAEEGERDPWVLAARYAAAMLPGIFRADDPANRVALAPEDRARLEAVLERLPGSLFAADDALGWVYQFWQSERKKQVNESENKIGGADLPPMTQLFTEHYMVRFLLENSLGAWWAGRHPDSPLLGEWEYLRFRDDGVPAFGTFEAWPAGAGELTIMDPCCGSGHFLTAAADMLRRMRMEEEGLTQAQAAVAVIRDNLFGLELDARCLQLAAFNLALDAWKAGGYQQLPIPNLACTGIAIKGQRADWRGLAGGDTNMVDALDRLYGLFQDAPELGSLIDPPAAAGDGLWAVDVEKLLIKLDRALRREAIEDPAAAVFGAAAAGTARAAQLLSRRYWLVTTNPPFLGAADHVPVLGQHLDQNWKVAKHDLAYAMTLRMARLAEEGGGVATVCPQGWMYLAYSRQFRQHLLRQIALGLVGRIGTRGFAEVSGEVVNVALLVAAAPTARIDGACVGIDASAGRSWQEKAELLRNGPLARVSIAAAAADGAPISFGETKEGRRLGDIALSAKGICTGDYPRFGRKWWEVELGERWARQQTASNRTADYVGRQNALMWERGTGELISFVRERLGGNTGAWIRGHAAWGRRGVAISRVSGLQATTYDGDLFEDSIGVLVPARDVDLLPMLAFCSSPEFAEAVRAVNQKLSVDNTYLKDIPFDLEHWTRAAAERYPDGLPEPHSDDPTQWLFRGRVADSDAPLQVAVARLIGFHWPEQEPDALDELADRDGLVPLVSVSGERPAAERLRALLARAYGDSWSPALLDRLLADAGSPGATLETWLRDDFFTQHSKLFTQRPFIWHVWDGRKDGFSVLCHYHRLDRARFERLTYTLLGDWIERQKAAGDEPGAAARLSAAVALQKKLAAIVVGEAPLDIYVRWKTLAEQPIGWEPDIDDGIRLNIRPFVTSGALRAKVNVKWDKDRGKNPDGSERTNDLHPTLAEKRAARAAVGRG